MKHTTLHNVKAFLMLLIFSISSIGMPLITHSCSHDNKKDIHLFSSEHHCEDSCTEAKVTNENLSFNKVPCCSFETNFLKSDNLLSPQIKLTNKQFILLSYFLNYQENKKSDFYKKIEYQSPFLKRFGYKYRIAMQSFLC